MIRVLPWPAGRMSTSSPLRSPVSFSITTPVNSSSTSTITSSIGSSRWPSSSRVMTRGREIDSSNPSRRMFSISTPICSSPRPETTKASPPGVSSTRMATFDSASRSSRSRITRDCTLLPSRPARGESLMPKVTLMVGGSIGWAGSGASTSGAQMVSATVALPMPARVTMSPATASSMGVWVRPRKASTLEMRNCSTRAPSRPSALTVSPARARPDSTRPVSSRPRNGSAERVVASMRNGSAARASCAGGGTWRRIRSNSAAMSRRGPSSVSSAQPLMPLA